MGADKFDQARSRSRSLDTRKGSFMTDAETAQLAINTIRSTRSIRCRRPIRASLGTPMALAPLVYTLWNRVMRINPQIRSGQTAIASCCRMDMPGCSLVRAPFEQHPGRQRGLRGGGEAPVTLDDIRRFRQLGSKAPGHPEYRWCPAWRRRPDRSGRASHERWHGHRAEIAGGALQQARLRNLRLQRLCHVRRRLSDGRSGIGGRVTRRPSRARRPLLGL